MAQTMAATKRNAGLTSAIPRPTLNDEDLVRNIFCSKFEMTNNFIFFLRKRTFIKSLFKLSSIRFHQQLLTILRLTMQHRQLTATSVKVRAIINHFLDKIQLNLTFVYDRFTLGYRPSGCSMY